MTTLVLVRHGQASFGQANYDKLSQVGERQAAIAGRHLQRLGWSFDAMLSGDMSRQRVTGEKAAAAWVAPPAPQVNSAFNEYDAGNLFKAYLPQVLAEDAELARQKAQIFKQRKLFQRAFVPMVGKWLAAAPHDTGTFESWAAFRQRVTDGLMHIHRDFARDAHVALFTSGGPIAVAVGTALGLADEAIMQINWSVYNTAITELQSNRAGWRLMGFNTIDHLRLQQDAALITHR